MMSGIERLLRPKSIAVIGGGAWCSNVIEQCGKIGFAGEIWPVHPSREIVCGLKAFKTLADLPEPPDASFIGINRNSTIEVVRALSAQGAGGAVCFASGFLEAQAETEDGAAKQRELLTAAGEMTILGPNCYGFLNYLDGAALWPDQHGGVSVDRGVAIVTQSSNIAINLTMQDRGLPIAYMVTAGNQAQTGISAISQALLDDDRVTALGLHIEGLDDLRAFEALAAKACALGKPIVALKVGKSEQARSAAVSHTASLSGSDAGADALLRRLGIGKVSSLPALLETLKLLHVVGPLPSNRIASMSCSGGEASLMADTAHGSALCFPPLEPDQKAALRNALGPKVALANPLDYHTYIWGDVDALTKAFSAMMIGDLAMGCVVLDFPRSDRCDASEWEDVIDAVAQTQKASGKPVAILASLKETIPEAVASRLVDLGIVPFAGMDEAIAAMEVAAWLGERPRSVPAPLIIPRPTGPSRLLSERDAKSALRDAGVEVPRSVQVNCSAALETAANEIGFPIVLKGEGIAHKTEVGAVVVGLQSTTDLLRAANAMPTDTYLVEEMVTDTIAELLVGVIADPAHGYVLTLAAGGTLTELIEDRACVLLPATRSEIGDTLSQLRISRILEGYRGRPAANINAILDAIMAVTAYVSAYQPAEIEINPLICGRQSALAADALIRFGDQHE